MSTDEELRRRIFANIFELAVVYDNAIPRDVLMNHELDGQKLPLIDIGRGIRNPRELDYTLSVTMKVGGPYSDKELGAGLWRYSYQSGGPGGSNIKLRRAYEAGVDIILFINHGAQNSGYQPIFPVKVIHDDPNNGFVLLALSEFTQISRPDFMPGDTVELNDYIAPGAIEQEYAKRIIYQRVHQPAFRNLIMVAYEDQCAVCRFRHRRLLDAAHIIPDGHVDMGAPVVSNGIALCKIHHAAYDENFLGITPEFKIEIKSDLLEEVDGPMLRHGLQEMHGESIILPKRKTDHPDQNRLQVRYEQFKAL